MSNFLDKSIKAGYAKEFVCSFGVLSGICGLIPVLGF